MAESKRHLELKRSAAGWLAAEGYLAVADEVSLPVGGFRVDVAGWSDRRRDRRGRGWAGLHPCVPRTCLIECKVSRADFARDGGPAARLLGRAETIRRELRAMGSPPGTRLRRLGSKAPTLFDCRGTTLGDAARDVRRLRLELVAIDRRLAGRCKFAKMAWWGLADLLWIAAPVGLLGRPDLPIGWGLLEADRDGVLRIAIRPSPAASTDRDRHRILRGIAVAASRARWAGATQLPLWAEGGLV